MVQSTKKSFNKVADPLGADATRPAKSHGASNYGGKDEGQMRGNAQMDKFADPLNEVSAAVGGLGGTHNDIGELSGFIVDGYLDKQGTPYGEAAKFNFLPPGMDISNQENVEIHSMPMRYLTDVSYPGDGWMPKPRDLPE